MIKRTLTAIRGIEHARARDKDDDERRLIPTRVNGRTEMLPSDPVAVARILTERRSKSPAARLKAKVSASIKKRGR